MTLEPGMYGELNSILDAIGHTLLIRLNQLTEGIDSRIYVKLEYMNPGGSVKDRIGVAMIEAAEREGRLKPGDVIIEATAGNTGVGLALAAAVKGYRMIFVLPDKMSEDKVNLLKAYGSEIVITPTAVPPDSAESYNGVAERLARELPGAFRPNQFENPCNPEAHYRSTGPEIWRDSGGKVEVFVASMGTGGTISGTGRYLKEENPRIVVVGADPEGSILSGDSPKPWLVEGIGEDFIPRTFDRQVVDEMVRVPDRESFHTARRLAREEGLLVGGSSGTAVAAALKYAQRLQEPKYMVVLLPDTGRNYLTKIFSDDWMQEHGLADNGQIRNVKVGDILQLKNGFPALIYVKPEETLEGARQLMGEYNISQLPVVMDRRVVGHLDETTLMKLSHDGIDFSESGVEEAMGQPMPTLDEEKDVAEAYRLLLSGCAGVVVTRAGHAEGVLTRADLITYWAKGKT